uniref:Uncharacterized protein n=1 Tax=Romanomermis culicivorax TaxID=13658 RepID=A0A915ICS9_ROMCU
MTKFSKTSTKVEYVSDVKGDQVEKTTELDEDFGDESKEPEFNAEKFVYYFIEEFLKKDKPRVFLLDVWFHGKDKVTRKG